MTRVRKPILSPRRILTIRPEILARLIEARDGPCTPWPTFDTDAEHLEYLKMVRDGWPIESYQSCEPVQGWTRAGEVWFAPAFVQEMADRIAALNDGEKSPPSDK